jgi:hypothetical protein
VLRPQFSPRPAPVISPAPAPASHRVLVWLVCVVLVSLIPPFAPLIDSHAPSFHQVVTKGDTLLAALVIMVGGNADLFLAYMKPARVLPRALVCGGSFAVLMMGIIIYGKCVAGENDPAKLPPWPWAFGISLSAVVCGILAVYLAAGG